jgi:hypothetical protein
VANHGYAVIFITEALEPARKYIKWNNVATGLDTIASKDGQEGVEGGKEEQQRSSKTKFFIR